MVESTTLGVQAISSKPESGEEERNFQSAIIAHEGDIIVIKTENPKLKLQFNYVPMLEFLYQVEGERRKIKMKR